MPRITYVKKAQQRYERVPVLDESGNAKQVPVSRVTKTGRPVFKAVTIADKTKPLPNHRCDKCGGEIKVGDPYKWIAPKSGPYGGTKKYRCEDCPNWQVWEYSSSLSANLARLQYEGEEEATNAQSKEDMEAAAESIADSIQEISEEQAEKADNIEDGFGHETSMSEELREQSEQLEEWADEVRDALSNVDDLEEEVDCEQCDGNGRIESEQTCSTCVGSGVYQGEHENEPCPDCDSSGVVDVSEQCEACEGNGTVENEEGVEEWLDEARNAISDALSNCPL